MPKTIIVALDGSEHGEKIISEAIFQAQTHNAQLVLVNVVAVQSAAELYPDGIASLPNLEEILVEASREVLTRICEEINADGVHCEGVVHRDEQAHEAIIEEAQKHAAIMIIMGSHGHSGLMHMLMGSVTEKVIGHATCPVLVVSLRNKGT